MFANFLFYQRGEVWCLRKLSSWQRNHNCVEFVDQKLCVEWTAIQSLNKRLTLQKCGFLALSRIDRLLILYLLSRFSGLGLNFLSAVLVLTLKLLFRLRDEVLQVLPLLLCSKALFLKLHIDSRHFAVHFLLSLVFQATFVLQQLSLSACRAIHSNDDLALIFRYNFKVAFTPQIGRIGGEQLDTRR